MGITRLPDDHFFVALFTGGSDDRMKFFRSNGTDFNEPGFKFCEKEEGHCNEDDDAHTLLTTADLQTLVDLGYWRWGPEPQSLNFVNEIDNDDALWLIGAVNSKDTAPVTNGSNHLYVWEVTGFGAGATAVMDGKRKEVHKELSSEGNMASSDPVCDWLWPNNLRRQEANFSAGAGAYVSPSGELLYYATSYWNLGEDGINRMAELRHREVSSSSSCGPQFNDDHLGGSYSIPEASKLTIDGEVYVIEPWAQMYAHPWHLGPSFMLDWQDQSLENWRDFRDLDGHKEKWLVPPYWADACKNATGDLKTRGTDGFDNCMDAFRFCGPAGSRLEIYDDNANDGNWAEADGNNGWISCMGDGSVISVTGFDDGTNHPKPVQCKQENPDKKWSTYNDQASSARIVWTPPTETYVWQIEGLGFINPIGDGETADYYAGRGTSTTTVDLTVWGETVSTFIDVYNVPPTVESFEFEPEPAAEGEVVAVTVNWSDPGAARVNWTVDWGDGTTADDGISVSELTEPYRAEFTASHVYADNGTYTVAVRLDDSYENDIIKDGITNETKLLDVYNVAPHNVDAGLDQVIYEGDVVTLDPALFSDMGTLDTHTATVDWGDESALEDGAVSESPFGPPGSTEGADGTVAASHQYVAAPGDYTVEVCVLDDDGAETCDSLNVTLVHGFLRFCTYADDEHHALTLHKEVIAACSEVPSGIPGEMRDGGVGGRGDVDIDGQTAVEAIMLSLSGKINIGQEAMAAGPVTAGDDVTAVKGSEINGSISSGHRVNIKQDASVYGDITAADKINVDERATVSGVTSPYTPVLPIPAITWVDYVVEAGTENVILRKGAVWTLETGVYRDLKVGSGAMLILQSGQYVFRRITVEKGATLLFDLSAYPGTAVIDVADKLLLKQDVQMIIALDDVSQPTGEAMDILWYVANTSHGSDDNGDDAASVQMASGGAYLGTFLAPHSNVQLGDGVTLEGALYGRKVKIEKGATIIGRPALDLFVDLFVK